MRAIKQFLLFFWNKWHDFRVWMKQKKLLFLDRLYVCRHPAPKVLSIADTLQKVADEKLSVSRYGDGEIKLISGIDISFQDCNPQIQKGLTDVLSSDEDGHLVCLPDVFSDRRYLMKRDDRFWKQHLSRFRPLWYKPLRAGKVYGNAFMSRCYYMMRDKSVSGEYFRLMRRIWDGQDVLLVEGEKSRLGVGNDLLDNAKSVQRILGPVRNAWEKYDALLEAAKRHGKDKLILLALGPTASVMAFDLFQAGYRAVDLGHADIEYEWYLSGATNRMPVKNKYVNEAGGGDNVGELEDETYQSQIVESIL